MHPLPPRSGRTRFLLLALLAAAAALFLLGKLLLAPSGSTGVTAPPAGAPRGATGASAPEVMTKLDRASSQAADEGRVEASGQADVGPLGVRLAGPGRVSGRLIDRATGRGVGGARVELLPVPPGGGDIFKRFARLAKFETEVSTRLLPVAAVQSEADGSFAFAGVRSGTYFLDARAPYHVPERVVSVTVLASGEGGPVDCYLRAGGRVVGEVLTPEGQPLAQAKVVLMVGPERLLESARRGDWVYRETETDSKGAFALFGAPEGGDYLVTALHPSWCLTHQSGVRVAPGQDTPVELRMRLGGELEGRILGTGEEPDATKGIPLAGAHVAVVPRGWLDLAFVDHVLVSTHAQSGPDGTFRLRHCPPGQVDLVAWAPEHLPAHGPSAWIGDGGSARAPDFQLENGPMLIGRVVDPSGAPIEGVQVRWDLVDFGEFDFQFSASPLLTQALEHFEYPTTDEEGRFRAGPLRGNRPRVEFRKLGWERGEASFDPAKAGEEVVVTLTRGGSLEGIVMDASTHRPVRVFRVASRARIATTPGEPGGANPFAGAVTFEQGDGLFRLDQVRAGKVDLEFSANGYAPFELEDVQVEAGQVTRGLIVELSRGGRIAGRVLDPDGRPVAGALLHARTLVPWNKEVEVPSGEARRGPPGRRRSEARRNDFDIPGGMSEYAAGLGLYGGEARVSRGDGTYEIDGVAPGQVEVRTFHRDWASARIELQVPEGSEPTPLDIRLQVGSGLKGTVRDRFDRPVKGVFVLVMAPQAMGSGESTGALYQSASDAEGRYQISNMAPGSYFVVVAHADDVLSPLSLLGSLGFELVNVPPGEVVEFDLVDTSVGATRVYGQVGTRADPVTRGNVAAFSFEADNMLGVNARMAAIQPDGTYEFKGLPAGSYQFHVSDASRQRSDSARIAVEVPDTAEARIDLFWPEGRVEGRVIDARSHEGVSQVQVELAPENPPRAGGFLGSFFGQQSSRKRAWTNAKGEFALEHLQSGAWTLHVRPQGAAPTPEGSYRIPTPQSLELAPDEFRRGLTIELQPGLELTGSVRDVAGAPLSGALVMVVPQGGSSSEVLRTQSDAEGKFVVRGLSPGKLDVRASLDGYGASTRKDVEVKEDQPTKPVELVLEQGTRVRVRVTDRQGMAVAGASARLVPTDASSATLSPDPGKLFEGWLAGQGLTDAQGWLDLGALAPGEYRLEAQRGSARAEPKLVTIAGGGELALQAVLK
jgi:hypothetical protein